MAAPPPPLPLPPPPPPSPTAHPLYEPFTRLAPSLLALARVLGKTWVPGSGGSGPGSVLAAHSDEKWRNWLTSAVQNTLSVKR